MEENGKRNPTNRGQFAKIGILPCFNLSFLLEKLEQHKNYTLTKNNTVEILEDVRTIINKNFEKRNRN